MMRSYLIIKLIILLILFRLVKTQDSCSKVEPATCEKHIYCLHCIKENPCCVWCYDENFQGPRCNKQNSTNLQKCKPEFLENNFETKIENEKQVDFKDVVDMDVNSAVQLNPSEFNVTLRVGEPVNLTVGYKPAKNYPLDLYYLMDLTKSMEASLNTVKTLGANLTELLVNLTEMHQIAFGSYIDKTEMPFYFIDPEKYNNPCAIDSQTCDKAYLFKHRLNFTANVSAFIEEVRNSGLSANEDDFEGGMDALMQILVCGDRFGLVPKSRKLVVIATEGPMHLAGDGILAGYVKKTNNTECFVDNDGQYNSPIKYDYPSLEEIHHQLKSKKTNVIIAATSNVHNYYQKMSELLTQIFVGELATDSSNVLELVKNGYYAFAKSVNLFVQPHLDELEVRYFADCKRNGIWEERRSCTNAEVGKVTKFRIQLLLKKCLDVPSKILHVEENNIYDKIKISVNFVCSCKCPGVKKHMFRCNHGQRNCGNCTCADGWTNPTCSKRCENDILKCRLGDNGIIYSTCSGFGDCICSKCQCYLPHTGNVCQNVCPFDANNLICGGRGMCQENGTCVCNPGYSGRSCTCFESQEGCKPPESQTICNKNGNCTCNACHCEEGYSGHYCQICDVCIRLCDQYNPIVEKVKKGQTSSVSHLQNKTVVISETSEDLSEDENHCIARFTNDDGKNCEILYKIQSVKKQKVEIQAMPVSCYKPMQASVLAGVILAVILGAGILIILAWKAKITYQDRREYQVFIEGQKMLQHLDQNPIYKSPVTSYENPMDLRHINKEAE